MDERGAYQYSQMSSVDKGPRPFFSELANPPWYDEHGLRFHSWKEMAEARPPKQSAPQGYGIEEKCEGGKEETLAAGDDTKKSEGQS